MSRGGTRAVRFASAGVGYRGYLQVATWLGEHLKRRAPDVVFWLDYHRTATWFRVGADLLRRGEAELCLLNTRGLGAMAMRGRGLFAEPFPSLRALAALPHHDWLVFAVARELGVGSFAALKERRLPLKLATGYLDGDNVVGFFAEELLERHGIGLDEFRSWGGELLPSGFSEMIEHYRRGDADAICQEGTFGQEFITLFRERPARFLSAEPNVVEQLRSEYAWQPMTVAPGFYEGQSEPFEMPDFSSWLLCCRDDFDDDLAYAVAQAFVDGGRELEGRSLAGIPEVTAPRGLPPVVPRECADTHPVPLHPGAERLYRERSPLPAPS